MLLHVAEQVCGYPHCRAGDITLAGSCDCHVEGRGHCSTTSAGQCNGPLPMGVIGASLDDTPEVMKIAASVLA
jgi:hypothetical protein